MTASDQGQCDLAEYIHLQPIPTDHSQWVVQVLHRTFDKTVLDFLHIPGEG